MTQFEERGWQVPILFWYDQGMPNDKITECSNCQGPVAVRRPSASGHHYCQAPACQAAKQRYYRGRRAEQRDEDLRNEFLQLVHDLLHVERRRCDACGLEDALPGWVHRDATGLRPCYAWGNRGKDVGLPVLDQIHPGRVPTA